MILVFDIGTTVLKGALLTGQGVFRGFASRPMSLCSTAESGCYESDSGEWITAFRQVAEELIGAAGSSEIRAAAVSGNGPTLVPVSRDGTFLEPIMSWMDRRGTAQSKKLQDMLGYWLDPTFYLPKAMWIADNLPSVYEQTEYFLSCPESMAYWLTGEAVTVLPGVRFKKYFWTEELLTRLELDSDKFPPFVKAGHITGKVTAKAASESGLPEGLPVISAGPDFVVTLIGTAAVYPGRACDRAGTSEGINLCTAEFIEDRRLLAYGHVVEPYYNLSGIISTSGKAVEWIKDKLDCINLDFDEFFMGAEKVAPGSDGLLFLPYLTGERAPIWDPAARGAFIGLSLGHGRAEMVRAVLESIGYAMRDVIDVMTEIGGKVEELRITGGPSKSDLWNQIKADITGCRILVPESTESELLGNLVLALRALGDEESLAEAADRIVKIKKTFEPDPYRHEIYSGYFDLYRASYRGLKDIFSGLNTASAAAKGR